MNLASINDKNYCAIILLDAYAVFTQVSHLDKYDYHCLN